MRFSIVLELNEVLMKEVLSIQGQLKSKFPDVQWIDRDHLFLTVKFLGNPHKRYHSKLKKALERVAAGIAPFTVELVGVGCFPDNGPERVVYIKVSENFKMLERFAYECDKEFGEFRVRGSEEDFIPHIAIGRLNISNTKGKLRKTAESTPLSKISTKITETSLVLSRMDKKEGTKYEVISKSPFLASIAS